MSDEDYAPDEPETSFTQSDNHALGDVKLQPYTPSRIIAAQAMGLHYGMLSDDEVQQYLATGLYPQAAHDVTIVLWLCSLEDDGEVARAAKWPEAAFKKASDWGATHGTINRSDGRFSAAFKLFFRIMSEIAASQTIPKTSGPLSPKA